MKALVYHGPGNKAGTTSPTRRCCNPADAIVQVDTTTICGTDLHILRRRPGGERGRISGTKASGPLIEVGPSVSNLAVGDRVIISCITLVRGVLLLP